MSAPYLSTILLIDDDEISNLFNKIFIGKLNLNVNVDCVSNGKEALSLLISSEGKPSLQMPSLLLLDMKMPVMDGWEFLKAYEEQVEPKIQDGVVIVMLTTSADEGDMIKAMNNPNIKEFIQKPLSEKTIRELILKYFSNVDIDD